MCGNSGASATVRRWNCRGNSSTGATTVVVLSGTGNAIVYNVGLNWDVPTGTTDTIAGYNVYRANSGSSMYQKVSTSMATGTSFVDKTVTNGITYDYYVETVDASGMASAPSSIVAMVIPI